jgi:hypothetical protein
MSRVTVVASMRFAISDQLPARFLILRPFELELQFDVLDWGLSYYVAECLVLHLLVL